VKDIEDWHRFRHLFDERIDPRDDRNRIEGQHVLNASSEKLLVDSGDI
jgi:hypothetical protein